MPIYEYQCADCNEGFSKLQRVGATLEGVCCPHCKSDKVERKLSSFASSSSSSEASAPAAPSPHSCGFS